jgi:GntR family transcriptional regulator, transcriptional repressor for pyruvate dehydrogenase complex
MFRTVGAKDRLVDRVVTEIQHQIMGGQYNPGMMLPPERELCEQLGVSRTVLREAVRMLVSRGLLETRPGIGTIVKAVTTDHVRQPLSMILTQSGSINLDHLNQVRMILEVEIIQLAAKEATQEEIGRLKSLYQQMEEAADQPRRYSILDGDFHRALAEITHNPFLVILLDAIRDAMESVRILVFNHPGLIATVNEDHRRMVEYIQNHDAKAAGKAMRAHLEHARKIQAEALSAEAIEEKNS